MKKRCIDFLLLVNVEKIKDGIFLPKTWTFLFLIYFYGEAIDELGFDFSFDSKIVQKSLFSFYPIFSRFLLDHVRAAKYAVEGLK